MPALKSSGAFIFLPGKDGFPARAPAPVRPREQKLKAVGNPGENGSGVGGTRNWFRHRRWVQQTILF